LLEGQTAAVRRTAGTEAASTAPAEAGSAAGVQAAAPESTPTTSRKAGGSAAKETARKTPARKATKKAAAPTGKAATPTGKAATGERSAPPGRASGVRGPAPEKKGAGRSAAAPVLDVGALGLPKEAGEVASYIAANYKGVGPKSVQALLERFGASRVFTAFETRPDEVREVMGAARGDKLLEAWADDIALRRANATSPDRAATAKSAAPARGRGRRGGRGRSRPSAGK
jgi:hypothetical protein